MWVEMRAEAQAERDQAQAAGQDTAELDALNGELDEEITRSGVRGKVMPATTARRHRSTRRRQDSPDLPRRKMAPGTIGKTYTSPGRQDVPPVDVPHLDLPQLRAGPRGRHPGRPGRLRLPVGGAGRAALRGAVRPVHPEPAPLPRLRRPVLRRHRTAAAPRPARPHRDPRHLLPHRAAPGPRRDLSPGLVAARTEVKYADGELPVWHEASGNYLDPATGELLPTWDQALDAIGDARRAAARGQVRGQVRRPGRPGRITRHQPVHRLPDQVPHQAPRRLPPGPDRPPSTTTPSGWSRRCATSRARRGARTGCATASSPRTPAPACAPGYCRGKAHRREHLGYAGRRVLVSRKWSGKTLADHRADRKAWLLATLGIPDTDPARYTWEPVTPGDPDHMPPAQRLLHVVADRQRWHAALTEARRQGQQPARSFGNREGGMTEPASSGPPTGCSRWPRPRRCSAQASGSRVGSSRNAASGSSGSAVTSASPNPHSASSSRPGSSSPLPPRERSPDGKQQRPRRRFGAVRN